MILNVFLRILNLSASEFSRVLICWVLKLLFFTGVFIGWTTISASVVGKMGIEYLPVILMIESVFTLIGMLFFSVFVEKVNLFWLLVISVSFTIISLFFSVFFSDLFFIFILFALIAHGIFIGQASIFISNFINHQFLPSESERVFPVLESSETISGILAGVILSIFGLKLLNKDFFIIWISLLVVFLLILFVNNFRSNNNDLKFFRKEEKLNTKQNLLYKSVKVLKKTPFLQTVFFILLLNFIASIFVEFHFTKAVDDSLIISNIEDSLSHQKQLLQGLGFLQLFVFSSTFIFELLFANRITTFLGSSGSFLLHSFLSFLGVIFNMIFKGFFASVLIKHNYVLSSSVFKTAYENTFYSLDEDFMSSMREFFEGVLQPISCILGTLLIIIMQNLFVEYHFYYFILLVLFFLIVGMVFFSLQFKDRFTIYLLKAINSKDKKLISKCKTIMKQKGHTKSIIDKYKSIKNN